jgi:hypothetical protein
MYSVKYDYLKIKQLTSPNLMEDPTKYKQELNKMKEYKDEIKRKEHQILQIKLHLKD